MAEKNFTPDLSVMFAGKIYFAESVLAGLSAPDELRRASDAGIRCGMGRSCVENAGRSDCECFLAILID